jgi:hypothetical protein
MTDTGESTERVPTSPEPGAFHIGDEDWPAMAADKVVDLVDQVAAKTTGPALTAARAVVFGMLISILGTAALVLLTIGVVRVIDVYVPGDVWAAHTIVGGAFVLLGAWLWLKRRRPADGQA